MKKMSDFMKLVLLSVCFGSAIAATIATMQAFGFLSGLVVCFLSAAVVTNLAFGPLDLGEA